MGYNQEAYDAECPALTRALETTSRRQTIPERVTIFSEAQVVIGRMASEEPGPCQKYAFQAAEHIAVLGVEYCPITTETENSQAMRARERKMFVVS